MVTVDDMLRNASDYVDGRMSLEAFDRWFEDNADAYDDPAVRGVYTAIEAAFAQYYFDGIGQDGLKRELAIAVLPFEEHVLKAEPIRDDTETPVEIADKSTTNVAPRDSLDDVPRYPADISLERIPDPFRLLRTINWGLASSGNLAVK